MRPKDPPAPEYDFAYVNPPRSGNEINGVGVPEKILPRKIAPDDFTIADYDYKALFDFFFMTMQWPTFREFVLGMFESRNARGRVADQRTEVNDPAYMAELVREKAKEIGFDSVGITEARNELLLYEGDEPYPYKYAICLGTEQDHKIMEQAPVIYSVGFPDQAFAVFVVTGHVEVAVGAGRETGHHVLPHIAGPSDVGVRISGIRPR